MTESGRRPRSRLGPGQRSDATGSDQNSSTFATLRCPKPPPAPFFTSIPSVVVPGGSVGGVDYSQAGSSREQSRHAVQNVGGDRFLSFSVAKPKPRGISCRRLESRVCHGSCLASILRSGGFWAFVIRVPNERKGSLGGADYSFACNMGSAVQAEKWSVPKEMEATAGGENGGPNERTKRQAKLETGGESWQKAVSRTQHGIWLCKCARLCVVPWAAPSETSGKPPIRNQDPPKQGIAPAAKPDWAFWSRLTGHEHRPRAHPLTRLANGGCRTRNCQMRQYLNSCFSSCVASGHPGAGWPATARMQGLPSPVASCLGPSAAAANRCRLGSRSPTFWSPRKSHQPKVRSFRSRWGFPCAWDQSHKSYSHSTNQALYAKTSL
jgi:hypothetical protein